ncbi:2og-Fe oxygenase family protein [Grosmannia clavigera kw1407]|uniref:2og-Fe oxygenase family protein n=1 Tax=Grosmannia clavigera (strain kw1407 / UAMH 11150) TaxID=655863 RepID=F0XQH1_GROCL|nr:2og-Fe oxygenase family protein [Grosmannia clavigera kw1407]EFX00521.1 2og-Fe oxygenase family protein [Grosmannia clavigera kw1407]
MTTHIRLSSGDGPVYRTVLQTPLRDATAAEIPVIDIAGIFSSSAAERAAVATQIHAAATGTGFFYMRGHGIAAAVTEAARTACLDFFRQPLATKQLADATKSRFFNGYKSPQTQRINAAESVDVRETFSWVYDPAYDPAVQTTETSIPPAIAVWLRGEAFPWLATANLPHFRTAIVAYWQACLGLARALLHSFALSLGLPETALDARFSHPDAALALNYYPPIAATTPDVSIGSHTDFQLFTILWQDDCGGLQVLSRSGQWLTAPPLADTLVVNIGDFFQRITNDRYVSTVHRAQNHSGRERVSMPFFFGFNRNEVCGVLDTCVGPGETKKYPDIRCADWVDRRVRAMHMGSST